MLKIHIYLLLIVFFIASCSDSSEAEKADPSKLIKGGWSPSSEKIAEVSEITTDKSIYWIPEIKQRNASKVSNNCTYHFKDNDVLEIICLSELDQTVWKKTGTWNLSDHSLTVDFSGQEKLKFKIESISDSLMILNNKNTSNKISFNRKEKEESAVE